MLKGSFTNERTEMELFLENKRYGPLKLNPLKQLKLTVLDENLLKIHIHFPAFVHRLQLGLITHFLGCHRT